ncbi:hypothetical protein JYQ62_10720 [Nostoc sp. UHCC 0702]|nr:hypothetical protein JYQ62_10720 [Nostoc sp. UHCC 0702]
MLRTKKWNLAPPQICQQFPDNTKLAIAMVFDLAGHPKRTFCHDWRYCLSTLGFSYLWGSLRYFPPD